MEEIARHCQQFSLERPEKTHKQTEERLEGGLLREGQKAQAKKSGLNVSVIGESLKEMLHREIIWSEAFFLPKNF